MCDKILRDGLAFFRGLRQPSDKIVQALLRATLEFTLKTISLNDAASD